MEVDEDSNELLMIHTHKDVFHYNQLILGR